MADVVAVKDIEEVYGSVALYGGLTSRYRETSIDKMYLEEDIEVHIMAKIGPYVTLEIPGRSNSMFILPADKVVSKTLPRAETKFQPILDKYLPNRWYWKNSTLYLYYPELTLKNSYGLEHTIYDMVIRLGVDGMNGYVDSALLGKRYSFSEAELRSRYSHSHLEKLSLDEDDVLTNRFKRFCIGTSDTPFGKLMNSLQKRNSVVEFEMLIVQIEEYLKWESKEGKPHVHMDTINDTQEVEDPYREISSSLVHKISIFLLEELQKPELREHLVDYNGSYILDNAISPKAFMENVEFKIIEMFKTELMSDGDAVLNWDNRTGKYISCVIDNTEMELPYTTDDQLTENEILSKFNITPRIIKSDGQKTNSTVIPRLSPKVLQQILNNVNNNIQFATRNI